MKIKDQIHNRRELLGISKEELAKRVGVTEQAVRHWESGRSYPSKRKMGKIEEVLSFSLEWTEGARGSSKTMLELTTEADAELLGLIQRLPATMKKLVCELVRTHLMAVEADPVEQAVGRPKP